METKNLTSSPLTLLPQIKKRRLTNRKRGLDTAWSKANEFMSLKKGYPLMIGGVGGSGKTEIAFDILINSALMHKWTWFVLAPETGDKFEIVETILEKISGGKVLSVGKDIENSLSDEIFDKLMAWMNKYVRICDPSEHWDGNFSELNLNMENLFTAVHDEERRLGGAFDAVMIDTFNDLDIKPESTIVKNELERFLAWTKKKNYFSLLTNHTNATNEIRQKTPEGEWLIWNPPAKKEQWSYGQQFGKKGYQMMLVYEEPQYFVDQRAIDGDTAAIHARDYGYNMRKVFMQKSKPKGVGKTGMFELYYDKVMQRYYEIDTLGMKRGINFPKV